MKQTNESNTHKHTPGRISKLVNHQHTQDWGRKHATHCGRHARENKQLAVFLAHPHLVGYICRQASADITLKDIYIFTYIFTYNIYILYIYICNNYKIE